ncbi:hypothetical protein DXG01_007416 [Tephrocybe rancida]|nr:hypothetical protein DXG01_007416 [Tephrocybe rancida]
MERRRAPTLDVKSVPGIKSGPPASQPRIHDGLPNDGTTNVCIEGIEGEMSHVQTTDASSSDTPATAAEAEIWADVYKQAFRQTLGETSKGPATIIKHLTDRVLGAVGEAYRPYLVASNILLAEGMVKEAADRESPAHELTLDAYMEARRDSIGLRPFLDLGRWIRNLDIPPEVLTHPDIAKLEEQTIDLVSIANTGPGSNLPTTQDLYSYKKEFFESGAHHNYVTVALKDPIAGLAEGDRQAAIDYTCKRFSEILADFQRRQEVLPSFGEGIDAKVTQYVDVMMELVVGNIQWSLACRRYGHCDAAGTAEAPTWGDVVFKMDSN